MSLRVATIGTYDRGYARARNLRRWMERTGCVVEERHVPLWGERGQDAVRAGRLLRTVLRATVAYPRVMWAVLRGPRPDVIVVGYPGHFDMPVVALAARLRGIPVVFDMFISLYDTVVGDRQLAGAGSPIGRLARLADTVACRLATFILADTPLHADYFSELTGTPRERFRVLWLGAQEDLFHPQPDVEVDPQLVVFHGTFVPVQGVDTIVKAAKLLEDDGVRFRIIGRGQDTPKVEGLLADLEPTNVDMVGLVPAAEIPREIARAGLCLGMFGTSAKADRVIANKVFECLAVGRPVLTAATSAMRNAFDDGEIELIPAGDHEVLAGRIRELLADREHLEGVAEAGRRRFIKDFSDAVLAPSLHAVLQEAVGRRR